MILQLEDVSYLGITELVSGRTEIQTWVCLILEHVFFTMVPLLVPHIDLLMSPWKIICTFASPFFFLAYDSVPAHLLFHLSIPLHYQAQLYIWTDFSFCSG